MDVKKVLIYSLEYPPQIGGAGVFSYNLAKGLHDQKIDVTVLTGSQGDNKRENNFDDENDWNTKRISFFKTKFWPLFSFYEFIKINKINFDLIIVSNYTAFLSLQLVKLDFLKKKKYKVVFHGRDYDYIGSKPFLRDKIMIRKKIFKVLKYSNQIIAVSNFLKKEMKNTGYFNNDIKVIHHWIPDSNYPKKKSKINKSNIKLIAAGRIEKEKNFLELINSISIMNYKFNLKLQLDIYGDGTQKNKLLNIIKKNKLQNIKIKSKVSQDQLMKLYDKYDFLVSLSEKETFGLIFIEAMSRGCIVISLENGSIQEIIDHEHDGFILNSLNKHNIAFEINKIIKSYNLERIRENASLKIKRKFSMSDKVNEYLK